MSVTLRKGLEQMKQEFNKIGPVIHRATWSRATYNSQQMTDILWTMVDYFRPLPSCGTFPLCGLYSHQISTNIYVFSKLLPPTQFLTMFFLPFGRIYPTIWVWFSTRASSFQFHARNFLCDSSFTTDLSSNTSIFTFSLIFHLQYLLSLSPV